jgi:hypothetical protein
MLVGKQIMAHLMAQQDQHERDGKRKTVHKRLWMREHPGD